MKEQLDSSDKDQEAGEESLRELIKQAGDDARARKRKALAHHFERIQSVITEALSSQQQSSGSK